MGGRRGGEMNEWQKTRKRSGWKHHGLVEWTEGRTAFLSVVFSWNLQEAYQRACFWRAMGYRVMAGGPAVAFNPVFLSDVALIPQHYPIIALPYHNLNATRTTIGCPRKCPFCIVPVTEGEFREIQHWTPRPIICDNNFLAASRRHFDRTVDRLKPSTGVDFNQGLDARLLTAYHAQRLAELDLRCVRLAWDHISMESAFMTAFERLIMAGIPSSMIRAYVLIGFKDDPADALYRLETIRRLGAWPNPMRYQPLDAKERNSYVGPNWTDAELKRFMRYWANLRFTGAIPFDEFCHRGNEPPLFVPQPQQARMEGI